MRKLVFLALFLGLPFALSAQTQSQKSSPRLTGGEASDVGISAERIDLIRTMLQEEIANDHIPGAVALVARRGKIILHEAYGTANAEGKKLTGDAIFRIASQSKAITSTAVMMLWERGLFRLNDPISKYIPEFADAQVLTKFSYRDTTYSSEPAKSPITIRHLLTHTSGLGYGVIDGDERMKMLYAKAGITDLFTTEPITIAESVKKLAKLPLHHHPGEAFVYSEGLDVLGYFIEIVSGQSFSDFLEENLFGPLGMDDTHFYLPDDQADRLVSVQHLQDGAWENYPTTFYDPDYPKKGAKTFYSGGAGLSSTAQDYATFLQMYLNDGELNGVRILSRKTIESMMENQIHDYWKGNGRHYGLAFGVVDGDGVARGGQGSKGTFDWGGYFNTQYFADPVEDIIGVLMKQTQGPVKDQTGWKFRLMVMSSIDD